MLDAVLIQELKYRLPACRRGTPMVGRRVRRLRAPALLSSVIGLGLAMLSPAGAAVILVDSFGCSLPDAVRAANSDAPSGGCSAGSGRDRIELREDVELTRVFEPEPKPGRTWKVALPSIETNITIVGKEGRPTIRARTGETFTTLLHVTATGKLRLRNVALAESWIAVFNDGGTVRMNHAEVTRNYRHGLYNASGIARIRDSLFRWNTYVISSSKYFLSGNGAAIRNLEAGTVVVRGSTLMNNYANLTGAISNDGDLLLEGSLLSLNSFDAIDNYGRMVIQASSISRGWDSGESAWRPTGQGIWGGGGRLWLENVTISGHLTGLSLEEHVDAELLHVTLAQNHVALRRWGKSRIRVSGTIIAGNGSCKKSVKLEDRGANFADDPRCGVSGSMSGLDPVLRFNGGGGETHALLPGSVAIDAADDCGLASDQRGEARSTGLCDAGAYELVNRRARPGNSLIVFSEDFPTADLKTWSRIVTGTDSARNRLIVIPDSPWAGPNYELAVDFAEEARNPAYLVSRHPKREKGLGIHLALDFSELEPLPLGARLTLLRALPPGSNVPEIEILVRRWVGTDGEPLDRNELVAVVRDGGAAREERWGAAIYGGGNGERGLDLVWKSAQSRESEDGTLGYGPTDRLVGLDNGGARIGRVLLGAVGGDLQEVRGRFIIKHVAFTR